MYPRHKARALPNGLAPTIFSTPMKTSHRALRSFFAGAFILFILLLPARAQQQKPDLPPELKGAKIYHLPTESPASEPVENLVASRRVAYKDINTERLVLNIFLALQPVDRDATVEKIYFQKVKVGGFPVHLEPFNHQFKLSKTQVVELPEPIECSIVYSDLDSLAPLKHLIDEDKIHITGESFVEVKINKVQKLLLGGRKVVVPVKFNEEVPLEMFSDSPLLKLAAGKIIDALSDPATTTAISVAREHIAKLALDNKLSSIAKDSVYLVYCKYMLRNPKTGVTESFSDYGTGFLISGDGQVLTAKRVIQPWKFDPQIAYLIDHYHLEVDEQAYSVGAWPAGTAIVGEDGLPDLTSWFSDQNKTLQIIKTSPDKLEMVDYHDRDSGEKASIHVHVAEENNLAVLKLKGDKFKSLVLAEPTAASGEKSVLTILAYPYGLSQTEAEPKLIAVEVAREGRGCTLGKQLLPGESGAPLVDADGKVVALAAGGNVCIPVETIRSSLP